MDEKTPAKIIGIQFSILSPDEIKRNSVAEITSRDTYIGNKPVIGGLFDPRMGVIESGLICPTDGLNYIDTPGYFGHINLARPVFYIQYLNTIIKTFADGSYFYNLSPKNLSGNSYADFFFNSKEGYCEYFAGTFVLLARLGGIPSRIVSGYLGGDLNNIGDFYVFRQKDTHAWAEVWFEREGWVKVDPTKYIPQENVRNTLNDLFNYKKNTSDSSISLKIFKYVGYYLNYTDFIWTQHLLSYDNNQRKSFINNLINFKFSKSLFWIFIPISFFIIVRFLFLLNKKNFIKLVINFTIWRLRKKRKLLYSDTHQQILNKFSLKEKNKYQYLFKTFEIIKYSNKKIEYSLIFKSLI